MSGEPFETPVGLADRLDDLVVRVEGWVARSRPLMVAAVLAAVVGVVGWWAWRSSAAPPPVEDLIPLVEPDLGAGTAGGTGTGSGLVEEPAVEEPVELVIHVVGHVQRPGLVTVAEGARVSDAVDAAGGPTGPARLDRLNLATPLIDGMQVRVPGGDSEGGGHDTGREPLIRLPAGATAGPGTDPAPVGPIDLNRAGPGELETLPGIGPALAAAIVEWRDGNGGFTAVAQLEAVPGIGPAKLDALRDLVVV